MSAEVQFSDNYHDLCQSHGTGAGFQFEFYCEGCRDTWRSPFEPYRSGQASGWLRQAGNMAGTFLGGVGYRIDDAAEGLANAGYGVARDKAFARAIEQAKAHFNRCARCHDYFCARCFGVESGLCNQCAPDLATEVEAARRQGTLDAATESARTLGEQLAASDDVKTVHQLVCPGCGTEAHGGRFCPQCGHQLASSSRCGSCRSELPPGSRFCPECGSPAS